MIELTGLSRRALVATTALAAAPAAAKKKGKGKKKKKPTPLVLAIYTISDVNLGSSDTLDFAAEGVYEHLPTGERFAIGGVLSTPFPAAGDDPRALLVAVIQEAVASLLDGDGIPGVPADRVAVTLL